MALVLFLFSLWVFEWEGFVMGEREQRAVGASDWVEVNDKTYQLRPLVIQSLCDLEMAALEDYKRSFLRTFRANLDLVYSDGKERDREMAKKLEEVSRWTVNNLPYMRVFVCDSVPVTDGLKAKMVELGMDEQEAEHEGLVRATLATFLNTGRITSEEVKELTGRRPSEGRVRYDQWWVTENLAGMIALIHCSIKQEHPEITREDIGRWPMSKILEVSKKVGELSRLHLGNG